MVSYLPKGYAGVLTQNSERERALLEDAKYCSTSGH